MLFALNVLALLIVIGLCWFAMVFLTGRFHGHRSAPQDDVLSDYPDLGERDIMTGLPKVYVDDGVSCLVCEGFGATQKRGTLTPCHKCEGTGVRTAN